MPRVFDLGFELQWSFFHTPDRTQAGLTWERVYQQTLAMGDVQWIMFGEYMFKALAVLSGTLVIWMGARLFEKGVFRGGANVGWKDVVSVGKGGPGLIFATLGAVIAVYGIARQVRISVRPASVGSGNAEFRSAGIDIRSSGSAGGSNIVISPSSEFESATTTPGSPSSSPP